LRNQNTKEHLNTWQAIGHLLALHRYSQMPQDTTTQEKQTLRDLQALGWDNNQDTLTGLANNKDIMPLLQTYVENALTKGYGHSTDTENMENILTIMQSTR